MNAAASDRVCINSAASRVSLIHVTWGESRSSQATLLLFKQSDGYFFLAVLAFPGFDWVRWLIMFWAPEPPKHDQHQHIEESKQAFTSWSDWTRSVSRALLKSKPLDLGLFFDKQINARSSNILHALRCYYKVTLIPIHWSCLLRATVG